MLRNNAKDTIQSLRYTEVVKRATVEVSLANSTTQINWGGQLNICYEPLYMEA